MNDSEAVTVIRASVPGVLAVYRFGSSVAGPFRSDSDVDLALLPPGPMSALARFDLQERVAAGAGRDVDLVDLRRASTVMRMQVVSRGVLIHEADSLERRRFEDYVFSSYARLNEERRAILERVRQEGAVYAR